MDKDCLLDCEAMKACRNELEKERWSRFNDLGRMSDLQCENKNIKEGIYLNILSIL